jgi:hypothetical protein
MAERAWPLLLLGLLTDTAWRTAALPAAAAPEAGVGALRFLLAVAWLALLAVGVTASLAAAADLAGVLLPALGLLPLREACREKQVVQGCSVSWGWGLGSGV